MPDIFPGSTSKPDVIPLLQTFVNPFGTLVGSDYWMPKGLINGTWGNKHPFFFTGNPKFDSMLLHAAGVGVTALAAGALGRYIYNKWTEAQDEDARNERTKLLLAKAFPEDIPNVDMTREVPKGVKTLDAVLDKKSSHMNKEAGLSEYWSEHAPWFLGGAKRTTTGDLADWMDLAAPVLTATGGAILGITAMDAITRRKKALEEKARLKELSKKLRDTEKKLLSKAYGIEEIKPVTGIDKSGGELSKTAGTPLITPAAPDNRMKALLFLLFGTAALSAGIAAKNYADSVDPARISLKNKRKALDALWSSEVANSLNEIGVGGVAGTNRNTTTARAIERISPKAIESVDVEATPIP